MCNNCLITFYFTLLKIMSQLSILYKAKKKLDLYFSIQTHPVECMTFMCLPRKSSMSSTQKSHILEYMVISDF